MVCLTNQPFHRRFEKFQLPTESWDTQLDDQPIGLMKFCKNSWDMIFRTSLIYTSGTTFRVSQVNDLLLFKVCSNFSAIALKFCYLSCSWDLSRSWQVFLDSLLFPAEPKRTPLLIFGTRAALSHCHWMWIGGSRDLVQDESHAVISHLHEIEQFVKVCVWPLCSFPTGGMKLGWTLANWCSIKPPSTRYRDLLSLTLSSSSSFRRRPLRRTSRQVGSSPGRNSFPRPMRVIRLVVEAPRVLTVAWRDIRRLEMRTCCLKQENTKTCHYGDICTAGSNLPPPAAVNGG